MKRNLYSLILLTLLAPLWGFSQPSAPKKEAAFASGERLTFSVSYKAGLINSDVAEVKISTTRTTQDNVSLFTIEANAKVHSFYSWFFDLNDTYTSYLDAETLRPLLLVAEISEGDYRYSSELNYDWANKVVNTTYRNHKRTDATHKTLTLQAGSYDAIAQFFNLRCIDADALTPGRRELLKVVLDDTIRSVQYRFVGRENKTIKGLGSFKTLRFACQLTTSTGESFTDGDEFTIWISDDKNKIPLYIESPIRVGSVQVRLTAYEGLKYELSSRISTR